MRRSTHWGLFLGFAAISAMILGCSGDGATTGPKTVAVTGTVTLNGQPVSGARVMFAPAGGKGTPAIGTTDAAGKFSLKTGAKPGAVPGQYNVSIDKFETVGGSGGAEAKEMPADYDPNKVSQEEGPKNLLPSKYESPANSGLTATVTDNASKNVFDFKL